MNGFHVYPRVHRSVRNASRLLLGALLLVFTFTFAGASASAQFVGPTPLTLVNGWVDAPFTTSHAMVEEENGIVHFRGAIASGSSSVAFTLPSAFRPSTDVYVPVDMCGASKGRLHIVPSGTVDVEFENSFTDAQCFTALDGASYAPKSAGFTPLTLMNGWTSNPFSTGTAGVRLVEGTKVYFQGAISNPGSNAEPFVLPAGFRPPTDVYIPVDLCNATNGRLNITTTGDVTIQVENGTSDTNATCFTSLDGAWFAVTTTSFLPFPLTNGWTNGPFSTSQAAVTNLNGVVYFKGAIGGGTGSVAFTLANRYRPLTNVFVNVDLCGGTKGRLDITTAGVVSIEAQNGVFANAQCFTSLDGVSYVQ